MLGHRALVLAQQYWRSGTGAAAPRTSTGAAVLAPVLAPARSTGAAVPVTCIPAASIARAEETAGAISSEEGSGAAAARAGAGPTRACNGNTRATTNKKKSNAHQRFAVHGHALLCSWQLPCCVKPHLRAPEPPHEVIMIDERYIQLQGRGEIQEDQEAQKHHNEVLGGNGQERREAAPLRRPTGGRPQRST